PEIADHGLPDMNAKPREEWLQTLGFKLGIEILARRFCRESRPAGALDVVRLRIGCVPEHHHGVADEFVNCSSFGEESLGKHGKMAGLLVHEKVRMGGLGDCREIPDGREKDGNLQASSAKFGGNGIIDDPLDELLGDEVSERPYGTLRKLHGAAKFLNFPNA